MAFAFNRTKAKADQGPALPGPKDVAAASHGLIDPVGAEGEAGPLMRAEAPDVAGNSTPDAGAAPETEAASNVIFSHSPRWTAGEGEASSSSAPEAMIAAEAAGVREATDISPAQQQEVKTKTERRCAKAELRASPKPKGRGRRIAGRAVRGTWRFVWTWSVAGLAFLLVFAMLLLFALNDAPITLPGWLTQRIEAQLNRGLPAGRIAIGRIEVDLSGAELSRVRLRDLRLQDASGAEVALLNQVGTEFQIAGLLRGDFIPQRIDLTGAQMTVRRRADGSFDLSFGATGGVAGSLPEILERVDQLFSQGPLSRVETVAANDLTVTLEDGRTGRIWQVTGGQLNLGQTETRLDIGLEADVFNGTEDLATVAALLQVEKGSMALRAAAAVENARSGDIAVQSPALAFLGAIDAPIGGSVQVTVSEEGKVSAVSARLSVGAGRLSTVAEAEAPEAAPSGAVPAALAEGINIAGGELFLAYDPAQNRIDFNQLRILTDRADLELTGQSWLEDLSPTGWPESFVGQFSLTRLAARDETLLAAPVEFHDGTAEVKLSLRPLRLTLGRLRLGSGAEALDLSGRLDMTPRGPSLALDIAADQLQRDRLLALWPPGMAAPTRSWIEHNLHRGKITDAHMAMRRLPGEPRMKMMIGFDFSEAELSFMPQMPPITGAAGYLSLGEDRVHIAADRGEVAAPQGGTVDISGSSFAIADLVERPVRAKVTVKAEGPVTALLSLLDQPPLHVMDRAKQPVDLAEGSGKVLAEVAFPIMRGLQPSDITYHAKAELSALSSEVLVPGRSVSAKALTAETDGKALKIYGAAELDGIAGDIIWENSLLPEGAPPRLSAKVTLDQQTLNSLGVALPKGMVSGAAPGQVEVDFPPGEMPKFRLTSELKGLSLRLAELGYSKPANSVGKLEVRGRLGSPAKIEHFALDASGLSLTGQILLTSAGGFSEARFDRMRLNGWLDAPVTLSARGSGLAVAVKGGTLDFRKADFGTSGAGGGGGPAMPISVALDRLIVTDSIDLTGFRGEFSTKGGFGGSFTAKLNRGGSLVGTVAPQNGGTALRVTSQDAGSVLRDSGVATRIRGGAMELILIPTGQRGLYDGYLTAERLRVRGTPALAELISAASIVGLLQQLNGDGIVFDQVQARFLLTPNAVNLTQATAMGASMGITAQGSYGLADGALDMRGVFSPVFLLNGIGQIFGRKGEGLFGITYALRGTAEDPKVSVNPLSVLTPGMFREIFQTPPPAIR